MTSETPLLRQVHPSFIQAGRITSQVFRPTPKDENRLSVYNGDRIHAEAAYRHFRGLPGCTSAGVLAVTRGECDRHNLPMLEDGIPFPEHCSLEFGAFSKNEIEKIVKYLKVAAEQQGQLYKAESIS